jgi:ketosteroid isomerase-like protein
VRRNYEAFNTRDVKAVLELVRPDVEWRPALFGGGIVESAVYRGHEGSADFLKVQEETWETVSATPRAAHAIDDHVLVEVHLVAVGRMSGVRVERTTWNVIEVRDGKVASGRAYLNEAEGLEAAGLSK